MLTKTEKKWIVARQQNVEKSGWNSCESGELRHLVEFHHKILQSDWKDAAEFEARVSKEVLNLTTYTKACNLPIDCPNMSCKACLLRHARISVEVEMEKETANKHL